ncbi:hypothetical protein [Thalassospira xiamenensis]|uniref:Uncharacterized protein n=2 Tax=Thalassospira xiamenensis TaxID=220697 RepID=A0A367X1J7_9PROT|nr:hypothetical protein [Thalassospira xiamenensis]KZB56211.1 hypothetical protein AUP41_15260 [Thalassospira xiamenensis]RCK47554.1 hypothetical protein TH44_18020 [Thalassospira xiamenensis]
MTAQTDYQQALTDITTLVTDRAQDVAAKPTPNEVRQIFCRYQGTIATPMIEDIGKGSWKNWESWQLGGAIAYLSSYGTSAAVTPLRDIEQNYPVTDIQIQAKALADLLATLDVAVSEAKQIQQVQDAIKSGNADQMARAMLLGLAQIDPDWPVRASEIQTKLFALSADSFPAINEMADGKLSQNDVTKALVEILFEDVTSGTGTP